jgi:hypothetical protein
MKAQTMTAKPHGNLFLTMLFLVFASGTALAQVPVDEAGNTIPAYYEDDLDGADETKPAPADGVLLGSAELEKLVGPVALYPDDLLAIVLPASTYPLEVVQAARFLERLESDSSLEPDDDWDESIVALLNYPDVVRMMDEDIDWTWSLGEAVISQQNDVIAAVEAFRDRAYAAGNLKSDENQVVTNDDGAIEISPVSEEIIYVPYYEPEEVVVYQPRPVYHYYPNPYPVYYYPYPVGYSFASGYFWGVTTAFSIGWSNHYLHVYHPSYWGHPYYGYNYYGHYYRYPSVNVYNSYYVNNSHYSSRYHYRDGDYWRPRSRAGSRQDEPRVRNYHYPPGNDGRHDDRRRDSNYTAPNQLANRNNGRLALDLRERNDSDRNNVVARNNVRARGSNGAANTGRSDLTDRSAAGTSNRSQQTRAPANRPSNRAVGTENQAGAAPRNSRTSQDRTRSNSREPNIQFRDRSSASQATNPRNTIRPSQNQPSNRLAASSRNSTAGVVRQRETPTARVASPRADVPSIQQRAVAPRSSAPRVSAPQTSAPPRVSAPRASAPARVSAPRASAPARVSAPRASAPARVSAPRASAPARVSAPRASAPAVQQRAPSSQRSSGASQSRQGSSSSSRSRNRNH